MERGRKEIVLFDPRKRNPFETSPRIFLITTRREIQGLLAGPTLAVSLLERSLAFVTQDDSFDAMLAQNNFLSKWEGKRSLSSRLHIEPDWNRIENKPTFPRLLPSFLPLPPLLSSFFPELSSLPSSFFFLFFFKRSSILVRMTEGGGVTFASYEISIGGSMEDPSDYTSPLQKRRVFCPSLFGPNSENPEIQQVFEQRDTIPWTMRWNPTRSSIETILINSCCFFLSLFFSSFFLFFFQDQCWKAGRCARLIR